MRRSVSPVRLYTRKWCGYCFAARRLLEKIGVDFEEIPLDAEPELRRSLAAANGNWRTLPMVFIGDRFVGGYTELVDIHRRGLLEGLVNGGG